MYQSMIAFRKRQTSEKNSGYHKIVSAVIQPDRTVNNNKYHSM